MLDHCFREPNLDNLDKLDTPFFFYINNQKFKQSPGKSLIC